MKKRKVKLFMVCLTCSFFAWFISNLSEPYQSSATFNLNYIDFPEDKLLVNGVQQTLGVQLEAVGFQFLRFNFKNKTVDINLSEVQERGATYFITPEKYQKQIESQLSNTMRLLRMPEDTLFFDFQEVITTELPVEAIIELNFAQNYMLDGSVKVEPTTVGVTGPVNEIDYISELKTPKIELADLTSDFSETVHFIKPDSLSNLTYSAEKVTVSGKVSRFSEKIIEVPIEVLNLPKNMAIRTFPDKIEVLCKARMGDLKSVKSSDFKVIADFDKIDKQKNILPLRLRQKPKSAFNAALVQKKVEYILRNK